MHNIPICRLGYEHTFPDPAGAMDEGQLAYGGDLHPDRILKAYTLGIFPWFNPGDPILWWSPNPRALLFADRLRISKSFRRVLVNKNYTVTFDRDFAGVIHACAKTPRKDQEGSWIIPPMQRAYTTLHQRGFAHSVEVYEDEALVGGLYGISYGSAFFGESMFSLANNASKIALYYLCAFAKQQGFDYIDCQMPTPHLQRMGASQIDRDSFLTLLQQSNTGQTLLGPWYEHYDDVRNQLGESLL